MKLKRCKYSKDIYALVEEELQLLAKRASEEGIELPQIDIRMASVDGREIPEGLPRHVVEHPGEEPVGSYNKLCEYEKRKQTFQLVEDGKTIWIIGASEEALIYGFYTVAECLTGVLWTGMNEEDIRFGDRSELPQGLQIPALAFRLNDGGGHMILDDKEKARNDDCEIRFIKWMSRQRLNIFHCSSVNWLGFPEAKRELILKVLDERRIGLMLGDHSMHIFLPEDEFANHPDWFGMRKGKRVRKDHIILPDCPNMNAELPIQPCYSNKELVEYVTDRIAEHVKSIPQTKIFSLWPHDGVNNWCECPECLAKKPFEHMHDIALVLAEKLPESMPIEVIAYSNLLNVPERKLPYNERIYTLFCPYLRPYVRRIYEDGGPELVLATKYPEPERIHPIDDRDYGKLYRSWLKVCQESGMGIGIFEHGNNLFDETRRYDHKRYQYSPDPQLREDEVSWYIENGTSLFYLCAVYNTWPDSFHQTLMYKLFWHGRGILEDYAKRYYSCFGSAGPELKQKLQVVADALVQDKDVTEELDALDEFSKELPFDEFAERIRLWTKYIRMGRESRRLELAEDYDGAMENEEKIQAFLEEIKGKLERITNWDFINKVTKAAYHRFKEKKLNIKGTGYNY